MASGTQRGIPSCIVTTAILIWFSYRIRALGSHIQFWINDKPVMSYHDADYKTGHFAIQGHNPGMKVEAKELYYRAL